jgi:hypothetical protein
MMKPVQGYVTNDGSFFESKKDAAQYEAELELRERISETYPTAELDGVMAMINKMMPQLRRYCDAYYCEPITTEGEVGEETDNAAPQADGRSGFFDGTEEDLKGVLKLPTGRPRHVPDLGHRPYAKEVSDGGEVDGA